MNFHNHIHFAIASIIILGLLLSSCKTTKTISEDGFQNDFMSIKGIQCSETKSLKAIDSQVGTIDCETISFTYDFGRYSNSGPLTPKEEFRRSFDTYHHNKFFENRMIDPKVYKIFLDSVEVIDVRRKSDNEKLLFPCDPCNTTAEITFKGDTYLFPLSMSENQLDSKGFTSTMVEKDGLIYKYFHEDKKLPGLYITPKKNRYKNKNTLSLMVSKTTLSSDEVDQILRNVYLINQ